MIVISEIDKKTAEQEARNCLRWVSRSKNWKRSRTERRICEPLTYNLRLFVSDTTFAVICLLSELFRTYKHCELSSSD